MWSEDFIFTSSDLQLMFLLLKRENKEEFCLQLFIKNCSCIMKLVLQIVLSSSGNEKRQHVCFSCRRAARVPNFLILHFVYWRITNLLYRSV